MKRQLFVRAGVATVLAMCLAGSLMGCAGGSGDAADESAAKEGDTVEAAWAFEQEDDLPLLVEEGASSVQPCDGWCAVEGGVQLQLSGGSIPGVEIALVEQEGSELTVTLEVNDGPSTMDLVLSEWMLTPSSETGQIEQVVVDYGTGDPMEVPVLVQLDESAVEAGDQSSNL